MAGQEGEDFLPGIRDCSFFSFLEMLGDFKVIGDICVFVEDEIYFL